MQYTELSEKLRRAELYFIFGHNNLFEQYVVKSVLKNIHIDENTINFVFFHNLHDLCHPKKINHGESMSGNR